MSLAAMFLAHVGGEGASAPPDALDGKLAQMLVTAHAAWPSVRVDDEAFLAHLAAQVPPEGDLLAALDATHAGDLYLACACVRGDPQGLAAFETHFLSQVSAYLSRQGTLPGFTDDVKQALRMRLLVTDGDLMPRIARYTGRGPLGAWLRSVTVRAAIDLRRQHDPADPGPRGDLVFRAAAPDPELSYLRTKYAEEFREAFGKTLEALSARDGNVLRLYFLEGMTAADIGVLYKVSSRTVQRWIVEARQTILDRTHKHLRDKLKLSNTEFGALLALVESQVDVSIVRHLGRYDGDPDR